MKNTKRSLIFSVLALLLCFSLLLASTLAWFTDSATSNNNIIKTGNLDIALEKWDDVNSTWIDATTSPIFNYNRCEPGYAEVVNLRVVNLGDLAIKWHATITTEHELSALADVIFVYVRSDDRNDTVRDYISNIANSSELDTLASQGQFEKFTLRQFIENMTVMTRGTLDPEQSSYLGVILKMDENAGNQYQNLDLGGTFELKVLATQNTYESDSFGDQYDAGAKLPGKVFIKTLDDFTDLAANGGVGVVVNDIQDVYVEVAEGKKLELDLNGMILNGTENNYVIVNNGILEISGDGVVQSNLHGSIENWGSLQLDNIYLNVKGSKYGFHCKAGEVEVNNIILRAERGGLNVQGGKVTINGGSITTTGYSTNIGYIVYAASNTSAEVVINDGDFRYEQSYYRHGVLYAGQNATIIVNGGTFGKGGSNTKTKWITEASGGEVIVYGGSFAFDPTEWVADGYQAIKGSDGWWTVSAITG